MPEWLIMLADEAERTTKAAAARKVGVSRTAVSLALKGAYPGGTAMLERKVLAALGDLVKCPFLKVTIPRARCRDFAARPMNISDKRAFQHWSACRSCPLKENDGNA